MVNHDALGEIEDAWAGFRVGLTNYGDVYVPGEGDNPTAFIIGEAPGAQEEVRRRPFVGPSGQVLRELMLSAGFYADWRGKLTGARVIPNCKEGLAPNCWITNVMKFRPARNRTPTPAEITAARPLLRREWEAVGRPRLIIPVGGTALSSVLGRRVSILRMSGKAHVYASTRANLTVVLWPMIHPSFGLRTESARPLIEKDWENLAEWMTKQN